MEHAPFLQGFVTMVLRCSEEINNMSYVWRRLREQLGGDVDRKVNRMRFIKGRMVRVFLLLFFVCVCVCGFCYFTPSSGCGLFPQQMAG